MHFETVTEQRTESRNMEKLEVRNQLKFIPININGVARVYFLSMEIMFNSLFDILLIKVQFTWLTVQRLKINWGIYININVGKRTSKIFLICHVQGYVRQALQSSLSGARNFRMTIKMAAEV